MARTYGLVLGRRCPPGRHAERCPPPPSSHGHGHVATCSPCKGLGGITWGLAPPCVPAEPTEEQHSPGGGSEGSLPGTRPERTHFHHKARAMPVTPPGRRMRTIFLIMFRRVLSSA